MSVINEPQGPEPEEHEESIIVPDYPPHDVGQEKEKAWHEWMGIAVALTAMLSILAVIVSLVALGSTGTTVKVVSAAAPATPAAPAAPVLRTEALGMSIKADNEDGRRGPDGQWHDAFLPADVTVHAGDKVTITFTNYDSGPHSFVSPSLGVNQIISGGGSLSSPHTATGSSSASTARGVCVCVREREREREAGHRDAGSPQVIESKTRSYYGRV